MEMGTFEFMKRVHPINFLIFKINFTLLRLILPYLGNPKFVFKKERKGRGGQAQKKIDRKVNQHDKKGAIQAQVGAQGRKLQGCQIDRGGGM